MPSDIYKGKSGSPMGHGRRQERRGKEEDSKSLGHNGGRI